MTALDDAPLLDARGLELEYRDGRRKVRAVDGVDFRLERGEAVGLIGPSGSGKSSLLFLFAGLRAPDRGDVRLLGHALPPDAEGSADLRRRHIGFLFQEPFLVPYLTVRENALAHVDDPSAPENLERLAGRIGMQALLDERPHRLSGGERQRAGILRALAGEPDLILADEPTANLDQETGREVMAVLGEAVGRAALVVVTHDPAMLFGADRILHLRDGRLES